jgi:dTDP-4-dehydrorhamnose 3,5-epimerase
VIFEPTPIPGAFVVRPEPHHDERGYFARIWCRDEFAAQGIDVAIVQASVSHNRRAGTLRGMHFALPPSKEDKLVRCSQGRIHDVIVDLRPESPTYRRHFGLELDDRSHVALFIPHGLAHGFQTLVDESEVVYMMTDVYRPELAAGVRHDDPAFGIEWPLPVTCIAQRDRSYASFDGSA